MLCAQPVMTNKIAFRKIIKDLFKLILNILKFVCYLTPIQYCYLNVQKYPVKLGA